MAFDKSGLMGGIVSALSSIFGYQGAQRAIKNNPLTRTSSLFGGLPDRTERANINWGAPGAETVRQESGIKTRPLQGNLLDPMWIFENTVVPETGRLFEAAKREQARDISTAEDYKAGLGRIVGEARGRSDEQFESLLQRGQSYFGAARQDVATLRQLSKSVPQVIIQQAAGAMKMIDGLRQQTVSAAQGALNNAVDYTAEKLDNMRTGIEASVDQQSADLARTLASQGYSQDEIDIAVKGQRYGVGSAMCATMGEFAGVMGEKLMAQWNQASSTIAYANAAAQQSGVGVLGQVVEGQKIGAGLAESAATASRTLADMQSTFEASVTATRTNVNYLIDMMELQGNEVTANLFRSIREPVMLLSPALIGLFDMFRGVVADDNAVSQQGIANQMGAYQILASGMVGAANILGTPKQESGGGTEQQWLGQSIASGTQFGGEFLGALMAGL